MLLLNSSNKHRPTTMGDVFNFMKKLFYIKGLFLLVALIMSTSVFAYPKKKKKKPVVHVLTEQEKLYFESYFLEGIKYYSLNNIKQAVPYFEKAYTIYPESDGLNYIMAKCYNIEGDNFRALQRANYALEQDSKNQSYYLINAIIYKDLKQYDQAIKTYKNLITNVPGNEDKYYEIGAMYLEEKKYSEAIDAYNKVEQYFGKSLELTRQKQILYVKIGKSNEAFKEGQRLIDSNPEELTYQVAQAEFLYYNDKKQEALNILSNVLKKDPSNLQAHLLMYEIYKAQNNNEKAIEELKFVLTSPADIQIKQEAMKGLINNANTPEAKLQLLELAELLYQNNADDATVQLIYADALLLNEKRKQAWEVYCKATVLNKDNYNVWLQVLSLDYEFQKHDSLVAHGTRAVMYFPNQATFWYYKGIGEYFTKSFQPAINSLQEAKRYSVNNTEMKIGCLLLLADAYNELKQYVQSDAAFEEVLKYDKSNVQALNNYSYYLSLRKEKLELAKEMSAKVVASNPNEPNYIDTYAWVLYQMKDYKGAKAAFDKIVSTSNNGTILEHYGDVLYQLGDSKNALVYWKKAKLAGDTTPLIDKKITDEKLYE
jgi:tetratricopeptide (TPR) repeat protein